MNAIDMSQFTQAKSDQFNAEDFLGGPRTFRIASVSASGNKEQPINIKFEGEDLYFRPCKTVRRIMVAIWKADASKYVGQSLTLYRDPEVKYGGMQVGGIRVSHMSGITEPTMVVAMEAQGRKKPIKIMPLATRTAPPAAPAAPSSGDDNTSTAPGAAVGGDEPPAAALAFVEALMPAIAGCADIAALAELQAANGKKLERLAAYPKLHGDVLAMFNDRRAVLEGAGEGEGF